MAHIVTAGFTIAAAFVAIMTMLVTLRDNWSKFATALVGAAAVGADRPRTSRVRQTPRRQPVVLQRQRAWSAAAV